MREILFKAKRLDNGEWVEGSLITGVFLRGGKYIPYILNADLAEYVCFEDFNEENGIFEVIPETLCQYTGLTDKKGKRIWENDILSAHWDDSYPEDVTFCKVVWEENGFKTIESGSVDSGYLLKADCDECYEIAGNIFDNPELLEED